MTPAIKDRSDYYPTFSLDERDERWAKIRERMYQRGIDCLVIWSEQRTGQMGRANLRYVTHVPGQVDGLGLFPVRGKPVVFSDRPQFYQPYSIYE
ncbi:MAG: hypothetical protein R3324_20690, partial [Halobacteriales archaeon]|nr:hypothetical protein [Halobacteriales archaeon]